MTRIVGFLSGLIVSLLLIVPIAAAAEPWDRDEHLVITSGTDMTLPAGQHVDLFVVVDGHARIEGDARAIFVLSGTVDLVGSRAEGIVAIESSVNIDATSAVTGDIRVMSSTITEAPGSSIGGVVRDLGDNIASGWAALGAVLIVMYIAFAASAVAAGVVLAGVAARQVREATALISREPVQTVGAAVIGFVALVTAGVLAIVTVVGIPFGIGLLALVLPALFFAGYLVAGIAIGEAILAATRPEAARERPYLAAFVGLVTVAIVGWVPPIGGLIGLVGFGAVLLLMWKSFRGSPGTVGGVVDARHAAPAAV